MINKSSSASSKGNDTAIVFEWQSLLKAQTYKSSIKLEKLLEEVFAP